VSTLSVERTYEVPSYFPMRRGCDVALYQCAHVPKGISHLEALKRPNGKM